MSDSNMPLGVSLGILALVAVCGGGYKIAQANYNHHEAVCTITDKDRGADQGSYRVYTQQCGTLGNYDMWLRGKTDSGDVQGQLQRGHTYRLEIAGWRFSVASDFPNIISVKGEVTQ